MRIDEDRLILIVTGAHLRAEVADRPAAYRLRESMRGWLATKGFSIHASDASEPVVVCSDLWYLNQDSLRTRPTVSVGAPGVNALSAYLGDRLPSAFAINCGVAPSG